MRLGYYYLSFILGLALAIPASIFSARYTGLSRRGAVSATLTGFIAGIFGAVIMAQIYNAVMTAAVPGGSFSQSRASLYGGLFFMPLFMLIPARLGKINYSDMLDSCCAGVYLLLSIAKTGCFVYGCCYGIECGAGAVNPLTGIRVFPVQLLEAFLTLLIVLFLLFYISKLKKNKGSVYPLSLILYGTMRFFIQFLRFHELEEEKNLFLFMDFWQLVSLTAVLTGLLWLFFSAYKRRKAADDEILPESV